MDPELANILIPILAILFAFFGLAFGSFSNVLIYRLSNNVPLNFKSRSVCPNCGTEIKWYDNIPIVSYFVLKGKCRNCQSKISLQYPIIEFLGLFIFLFCFFYYGYNVLNSLYPTFSLNYKVFVYPFIMLLLIVIALIDIKTMTIPLSLQIALLVLILTCYVTSAILNKDFRVDNLIGLGMAAVIFLSVYFIYYLIKKEEGIGLGDVILYIQLGLFFGYQNFLLLFLISSTGAALVEGIKLLITRKNKPLPFAPYIAFSAIFVMIFGDYIIASIMSLFNI